MDRNHPEYKRARTAYQEWGREYIINLAVLCREDGTRLSANWGPKYRLHKDGLEIYVDDYGGYTTVSYGGIQVASTHFCDQYILKGDWMQIADKLLMIEPSCLGAGI